MKRQVHQLVIGAGRGDAITSMALTLRDALRGEYTSEVYAHHLGDDVRDQVLSIDALPVGTSNDVIVYHASFGIPAVTRLLLHRPEQLVLVYHNITPWERYLDTDPDFAAALHWGRHELTVLRDRVRLTIAVSKFNRRDLEELGYRGVHVVPVGLVPGRLRSVRPLPAVAGELRDRYPHGYVLAVSQVLPHKRVELLLQSMHLVQWVLDRPLGLVVVGAQRMRGYADALQQLARQLFVKDVWFTGGVDDAHLATCYRGARMFCSSSAHEGLAVPPLEAMAFGVPVVATGCGALPDTIGEAGIVLPADAGPMWLAEAIAEADTNERLRMCLVERGRERVASIERRDPVAECAELIRSTVGP